MTDGLLTVAETARVLRVCDETVRRWINAGDLEAIHLGRRVRITETALQVFLEQRSTWTGQPLLDALARLAQSEAATPICRRCGLRDATPGGDYCQRCRRDQQTEADDARQRRLESKRRWWDAHGTEAKARQRAKKANPQ